MCPTHQQGRSHKLSDQYFNVPDKYLGTLPNGTTYGKGGFREARLLVDGQLAGVAFPYLAIYTGGFIPAAWRWVVSYLLELPLIDSLDHRPIPSYGVRPVQTILSTKVLTPFLGT